MRFETALYPEANRSFRKTEKAVEWVREEENFWSWLKEPNLQYASQSIQEIGNALHSNGRSLNKNGGEKEIAFALKKLAAGRYLPSKSHLANHINEIRQSDAQLAAAMVYVAMRDRKDSLPSNKLILEAISTIRIFERGVTTSTANSVSRSIGQLRSRFENYVDETTAETDDLIDDLVSTTQNKRTAYRRTRTIVARWLRAQRSKFQSELSRSLELQKSELDDQVASAKSTIEDFVEHYENAIALQEPVSYWNAKRSKHQRATICVGVVFLLYALFLIYAAKKVVSVAISHFERIAEFVVQNGFAAATILLLSVGIGLIGSRILYRLFLSQLHLWNDASERVTMIKTYLALAKRDHAKEQHLIALTNRLFAPAADGVVKDDFGSTSIFDSLPMRRD